MGKRLAHRLLMMFLCLFSMAGAAGLVLWHNQGIRLYSMQNNSVTPTLQRGDLLLVAPNKTPHIGDIINLADPTNPRGAITRRIDSGQVPKGNIIGVTVKAVPLAGYGLDWLRRPAGLAVFIYVPAFMVLRGEFKRLSRHFGRQAYRSAGTATVMRATGL